jgi:choline kinase
MSPLVILAAGMGSRLQSHAPKSLQQLEGTPLLQHQIERFSRCGIDKFYVVTGFNAPYLTEQVEHISQATGTQVTCIHNKNWKNGNGTSVLTAALSLNTPFYLTMGDHLFCDALVDLFVSKHHVMSTLLVDIEGAHNAYLDPEDVTRVQIDYNGYITEIGKHLANSKVIDTGLFFLTTDIIGALQEAAALQQYSLSDGIRQLAAEKKICTMNCNQLFWMDIDTPSDFEFAQSLQMSAITQ